MKRWPGVQIGPPALKESSGRQRSAVAALVSCVVRGFWSSLFVGYAPITWTMLQSVQLKWELGLGLRSTLQRRGDVESRPVRVQRRQDIAASGPEDESCQPPSGAVDCQSTLRRRHHRAFVGDRPISSTPSFRRLRRLRHLRYTLSAMFALAF